MRHCRENCQSGQAGSSTAPMIALPMALRPAVAADLRFTAAIYFETMRYITDRLPDFDEARHMARFAERFVPGEVSIVTVDGQDVGWLQVDETKGEIHLKQMFLKPAWQRQGIGSQLLRDVIERGDRTGKPVRLSVVKINPALRLYERHGFLVTSEDGFKFYMERRSR